MLPAGRQLTASGHRPSCVDALPLNGCERPSDDSRRPVIIRVSYASRGPSCSVIAPCAGLPGHPVQWQADSVEDAARTQQPTQHATWTVTTLTWTTACACVANTDSILPMHVCLNVIVNTLGTVNCGDLAYQHTH